MGERASRPEPFFEFVHYTKRYTVFLSVFVKYKVICLKSKNLWHVNHQRLTSKCRTLLNSHQRANIFYFIIYRWRFLIEMYKCKKQFYFLYFTLFIIYLCTIALCLIIKLFKYTYYWSLLLPCVIRIEDHFCQKTLEISLWKVTLFRPHKKGPRQCPHNSIDECIKYGPHFIMSPYIEQGLRQGYKELCSNKDKASLRLMSWWVDAWQLSFAHLQALL